MAFVIEDLPGRRVAYLRLVGPYGPVTIPALWTRFITWIEGRGLLTAESLRLGIAHDSPRDVAPERCRYDACLVVPDDFSPDAVVSVADLPGCRLGVTDFVGQAADVRGAGDALWTELVASGQRPRSPFVEIYRGNPAVPDQPGAFRCQLGYTLT